MQRQFSKFPNVTSRPKAKPVPIDRYPNSSIVGITPTIEPIPPNVVEQQRYIKAKAKNYTSLALTANSGTVILITRGRPYPWLDYDEWIRVLSPQPETKNRWLASKKTEEDWKTYLDDFYPQMKETKPVEAIASLRQRLKNGETITLLCYCEPKEHCHRNIIKSLIEGR